MREYTVQVKGKRWEKKGLKNGMEGCFIATVFCLWSLPEDLNSYNSNRNQQEFFFFIFFFPFTLQAL